MSASASAIPAASAAAAASAASASSKKRKEPSATELAQTALLSELFRCGHSRVVAAATEKLGEPINKKQKKEQEEVKEQAVAAIASLNPFVSAMDAIATKVASAATTIRTTGFTANGALSHSTTKALNLDLFYHLARNYPVADLYRLLPQCWNENPEVLLQILMHARDCHGNGKGERLVVYYALLWLRVHKPRSYLANLLAFLRCGYFKDLVQMIELLDGGSAVPAVGTRKKVTVKKGKGKGRGKPGKSNKKASTSSSSSVVAPSTPVLHMLSKGGARATPLGSSALELHVLAEYLKEDWIKLKQWKAAKKAFEMNKRKAALADAAEKATGLQAAYDAKMAAGTVNLDKFVLSANTDWFEVDEEDIAAAAAADVAENKMDEDDGEWEAVAEGEDKDVTMSDDVPSTTSASTDASASSASSASPPAATATVTTIADPGPCYISLAAKWAPSERKHFGTQAKRLAKILFATEMKDKIAAAGGAVDESKNQQKKSEKGCFMSAAHMQSCLKKYRLLLSTLRAHLVVTERLTCNNEWDRINFSAVPSKCHQLLKNAFQKHCPEKYNKYLAGLKKGVGKINVQGLEPHQLVQFYYDNPSVAVNDTVEEAWKALVEKVRECRTFKSAVSVVDVSGSMAGTPMIVAIAMGLLVSELCEGPFKGRVLTFHESPAWHTIKGATLKEKVAGLAAAPWGGSTNLIKTFDLILSAAKQYKCAQSDLPQTLFIFSDMQFDAACGANWWKTNHQAITSNFKKAKYELPGVVYWNINGAFNKDAPVQCDTPGCALMSGFSADLLKVFLRTSVSDLMKQMVLEDAKPEDVKDNPLHPITIMMNSIEQYEVIVDESERP